MASASSTLIPPTHVALATGLVIFDLDGTVVSRSSMQRLDEALVQAGITMRRDPLMRSIVDALRRDRTLGSHRLRDLRAAQIRALAGADSRVLLAVYERAAREVAADLHPAARELLEHHLELGDTVVLTSSAPHDFVAALARAVNPLIVGVGTPLEIVDGTCTGRVRGRYCLGDGLIERLTQELGPRDLSTAVVYAAAVSALPLLRRCGSPVAVNPDGALRIVSKTHSWPVYDLDDLRPGRTPFVTVDVPTSAPLHVA